MQTLTNEQKAWCREISLLHDIASREGLTVELRNPASPEYQIARLTGDGVRLIVYPHKTKGTGNKHARVRNENSADKEKAEAIMYRMDAATGFNCTFRCNLSEHTKRMNALYEVESCK